MKILSMETIGHPLFGDQKFDFTDEAGEYVDTIILVGENGSGKTMLLEMILN